MRCLRAQLPRSGSLVLSKHWLPTPPLIAFGAFDERTDVEPITSGPVGATYSISPWRSQITEREHRAGVDAIRAAIRAGDTYQVNYTFQLEADFDGDPQAFYRDLIAT